MEGVSFLLPQKLDIQGKRSGTGSGIMFQQGLGQVGRDGAAKPGLDVVVHVHPVGEVRRRCVEEDVTLQRILVDDEKELIAPTGVVADGKVEDGVDAHCLGLQIDHDNSLVLKHSLMEITSVEVRGEGLDVGVGSIHVVGPQAGERRWRRSPWRRLPPRVRPRRLGRGPHRGRPRASHVWRQRQAAAVGEEGEDLAIGQAQPKRGHAQDQRTGRERIRARTRTGDTMKAIWPRRID